MTCSTRGRRKFGSVSSRAIRLLGVSFHWALQFHTPESFTAKNEVHNLYEEWRLPRTPADRRETLTREMNSRFREIAIPIEASTLGRKETLR
jgi:hypothetical protein